MNTRYRILLGFIGAFLFIWCSHPCRNIFIMFSGLIVSLFGLALRTWAAGSLNKSKFLAVAGPYAYVRHPLYAGSFLIAVGFGIAGSNRTYPIHLVLVWGLIMWLFGVVYLKKVKEEEDKLSALFGKDYTDFMARTPRFIPRIDSLKIRPEISKTFLRETYIKNKEYQAAAGWAAMTAILFIKRFFVAFALVYLVMAGNNFLLAETATKNNGFTWRNVENHAFKPGESLQYVIKYGLVNAGSATLSVQESGDAQKRHGRKVWKIVSEARTNKVIDAIFKVRDKNESWIDAECLCAIQFEQHLSEGFHKIDSVTEYDQSGGRFITIKTRKDKETKIEGEIPQYVQDVLSSLYYIRLQDLAVGGSYTFQANSGGKTWPLEVKVHKREKIKVPAGRFDCYKLEPILAGEGIFQHSGKLEVWVTADERKIPVLLRSRVMVGAFDAELESY